MPLTQQLGPARRRFLDAGFIAAPLLVLGAALGGDWTTDKGLIGAVVAWTLIPWLLLALAAKSFGGRDVGLVGFICGIAAVFVALFMTIAGGFVVAPAIATIPLAGSARAGGGWYRARRIVAGVILLLCIAWYVLIVATFGDYSDVF